MRDHVSGCVVNQTMTTTLTAVQAMEVARRLNPLGPEPVRFRGDGSVANPWTSIADWEAMSVEVWQCTRRGESLDVVRLTA